MFAGVQISSMFLFCVLIELDCSSAFPRARESVYSEEWQGEGGQVDPDAFGNNDPLQFIQTLQSNANEQDNDQINTFPKPQGHFMTEDDMQVNPGDPTDEVQPDVWSEESAPESEEDQNTEDDLSSDHSDTNQGEGDGYSPDVYMTASINEEDHFIPSGSAIGGQINQASETDASAFSPTQQISWNKVPPKDQAFPQSVEVIPASSWPNSQYPSQARRMYSDYYPQMNPTVYNGRPGQNVYSRIPTGGLSFPSQYEMIPKRHYINVPFRTSGHKYVQPQSWRDYITYGQFRPYFNWPSAQMVPFQSSYPAASPVQHGFPSFGYHKPVSSTTNYVMSNVMQVGHNNYSAPPFQYSLGGQSGVGAMPRITAFAPVKNFQDSTTKYKPQMMVPEPYTDREVVQNPTYMKMR